MVGIVTIGNDLLWQLSQSLLATLKSWFQLPIVDRVDRCLYIHYQPVGGIGDQLHVVARHGATFTVSHHVRFWISAGCSGYILIAVTVLDLLKTLDLTHGCFQATLPLLRSAALRSSMTLSHFLFVCGLCVHLLDLLLRQSQMSFELFLAPKGVSAGVGFDLGTIQRHPLHADQTLSTQHTHHLHKQIIQSLFVVRTKP